MRNLKLFLENSSENLKGAYFQKFKFLKTSKLSVYSQRRYDRVKESRLITTLITFVLLLDISVHFIWSFMHCKVKVHDVLLKLPCRACFTEGTAAI